MGSAPFLCLTLHTIHEFTRNDTNKISRDSWDFVDRLSPDFACTSFVAKIASFSKLISN